VAGMGMVKRHQRLSIPQPLKRNGEAHMAHHPTKENAAPPGPRQSQQPLAHCSVHSCPTPPALLWAVFVPFHDRCVDNEVIVISCALDEGVHLAWFNNQHTPHLQYHGLIINNRCALTLRN
jgi:hypothetical protein